MNTRQAVLVVDGARAVETDLPLTLKCYQLWCPQLHADMRSRATEVQADSAPHGSRHQEWVMVSVPHHSALDEKVAVLCDLGPRGPHLHCLLFCLSLLRSAATWLG